jgi:antitoxin ParD1/3/4
MGNLPLPEHLIGWAEQQVDCGRAVNVHAYLAQLVAEDRIRTDRLRLRRKAIQEARASGVSMEAPDGLLERLLADMPRPGRDRIRDAIREGRASGASYASLDGILSRALQMRQPRAA